MKTRLTSGPEIIGANKHEYWIGDRQQNDPKNPTAAMLQLTLSPMQALHLFSHFVEKRKQMNKGLPEFFPLSWIFTSLGQTGLKKRVKTLEQQVSKLEARLDALEKKV